MKSKHNSYNIDALSTYLRGLKDCPPLAREEEVRLARKLRFENDQDAANKLVRANLRAVVKVASRYQRPGVELLELIQEGSLGLLQAVRRFDPERGVRLVTYACWWIRAYVQRYIQRRHHRLAYLSPAEKELLDAESTDGQKSQFSHLASELSLDHLLLGDSRHAIAAMMADQTPNQEALYLDHEATRVRRKWVADGVGGLDPQEQEVISNRYLREDPRTLKEIGEQMGLSRQRIHQIEQRARRKLGVALRNRPAVASV